MKIISSHLKRCGYSEICPVSDVVNNFVNVAKYKKKTKVLIKSFQRSNIDVFIKDKKYIQRIPRELYFMNALKSNKYVPKLLNYHSGKDISTITTEYLDENDGWSNLFLFLDRFFDESIIREIILKLIKLLYSLSNVGVYYTDIKPENVMINKINLEMKIIDFEDCIWSEESNPSTVNTRGTCGYKSPESYSCQEYNVLQSQVFSIGCLTYFCIENEYAFDTKEETIKCSPLQFKNASTNVKSFITDCTTLKPLERLKYKDLLKNQWFKAQ